MHAHGRVVSVSATLQFWTETIGLPPGGVTLAAIGVRPGALPGSRSPPDSSAVAGTPCETGNVSRVT